MIEQDILIKWLHGLAEQGGKGTVNNIDARALGRCGDEITRLRADVERLRQAGQAAIDSSTGKLCINWQGALLDALAATKPKP